MTDPNKNEEERKRKKIRSMAEDMTNLELLQWASDDWVEGNDLDDIERDELSKCYRRRTNRTEAYDMSDNS